MLLHHLFITVGTTLQMTATDITPEGVIVHIETTVPLVACPTCHLHAHRVHSHYQRRLADLPLAQLPVRVQLHVRRFRCTTIGCGRTTFTEPVPGLAIPYARRTTRLRVEQHQIALDVGGEPGARLARRQGMNVSPDTLLRLVRNTPEDARPTPRCLGIDDVALRTGQRYGTLLVDLEAHQPVDLIEGRSAEVVAQWLQDHPGVDVISRDRSIDDAEGSSRGAPDALQVADRFHLLQNVREMLQRLLDGQQDALVAATRPKSPPSDPPPVLLAEPVVAPAAAAPGDTKPPADTAEASSLPNQAAHRRNVACPRGRPPGSWCIVPKSSSRRSSAASSASVNKRPQWR